MKDRFYFFLLISLCCSVLSSSAKPAHLDSIKVYIPFYGSLNDWSGWNNNGVSDNGIFGTDRYGNPQRAFHILDSSGYFKVPTKNIHVPTFTYATWVRLDEYPDSNGMTIFEGGRDSCLNSLKLFPKAGDSLWLEHRLPFGDADSVLRMPVRMPLNQWNHFTTMRSKDSVFLFANVLFNAGFYAPGAVCQLGDWVHYGVSKQGNAVLLGGLDEVRIYSENIEPSLLLSIVAGERLGLKDEVKDEVKVYPNPAIDFWTIQSGKTIKTLVIKNHQGQDVYQITEMFVNKIDLHLQLSSGIYLLELEFEDEEKGFYRLVVN